MPGAQAFRHELQDTPVLEDEIMRGNLAFRHRQPMKRCLRRQHAGIVKHDHVRNAPFMALAMIGRRNNRRSGKVGLEDGHATARRNSRSIAAKASLKRAMRSLAMAWNE